MNSLKLLSFFALALSLCLGCKSDDEADLSNAPECSVEDINGVIAGENFNFAKGSAMNLGSKTSFRFFTSQEVFPQNTCDFLDPQSLSIAGLLSITEVGRLDLFFNALNFQGETITLSNNQTQAIEIASEGFIEITTITDSKIEGFLKAKSFSGDVCGKFSVDICP